MLLLDGREECALPSSENEGKEEPLGGGWEERRRKEGGRCLSFEEREGSLSFSLGAMEGGRGGYFEKYRVDGEEREEGEGQDKKREDEREER